ncbi:replication protein A1-like protein [Striga asiatica]|uniref:Replication protein A1-like protein n=1 Tax=Striga asiatica TaxID=4170 RepID=A0A5A7PVH9_STRAF|nr:replication protein A1-like protein [Striga asiatica]
MDQPFGLIRQIQRSKRFMLKLRAIRIFEKSFDSNYRRQLEIVFHDEEGTRISGIIRGIHLSKMVGYFHECGVYKIQNYYLDSNIDKYRSTAAKYKLLTHSDTKVLEMHAYFPSWHFQFRSFDDFQDVENVNESYLFVELLFNPHSGVIMLTNSLLLKLTLSPKQLVNRGANYAALLGTILGRIIRSHSGSQGPTAQTKNTVHRHTGTQAKAQPKHQSAAQVKKNKTKGPFAANQSALTSGEPRYQRIIRVWEWLPKLPQAYTRSLTRTQTNLRNDPPRPEGQPIHTRSSTTRARLTPLAERRSTKTPPSNTTRLNREGRLGPQLRILSEPRPASRTTNQPNHHILPGIMDGKPPTESCRKAEPPEAHLLICTNKQIQRISKIGRRNTFNRDRRAHDASYCNQLKARELVVSSNCNFTCETRKGRPTVATSPWAKKSKYVTNSKIVLKSEMEELENGDLVVSSVDSLFDSDEWYLTCNRCKGKMADEDGKLRYKIRLIVSDATSSATFICWDMESEKIIGTPCEVLRNEFLCEHPNSFELPEDVSNLVGKTILFKVRVYPKNPLGYAASFPVVRVVANETLVSMYNQWFVENEDATLDDEVSTPIKVFQPIEKGDTSTTKRKLLNDLSSTPNVDQSGGSTNADRGKGKIGKLDPSGVQFEDVTEN